jgi:uncharacterized protein (DUF488 family)
MKAWPSLHVLTVGHSTRSFEDFVALLRAHHIETLVDVRTIPKSRRHPQFAQENLGPALEREGIHYVHVKALGGLRHAHKDSINMAWRNESFRGYADYMQTDEFTHALEQLRALASASTCAVMCAEAVPWRCHRSLISDALVARGSHVEHITSTSKPSAHKLTSFARVDGERVTYPALV